MSKILQGLIRLTLLFSCCLLVSSAFPQAIAAEQYDDIAQQEIPSPIYACWRLSYSFNGTIAERELKLEGDRGMLSTLTAKPSVIPVKVSDVDTDGWLRRQMFLWSNRLKQRSTTEYELAQVKQRIESGSLNGEALERAKKIQQNLQMILSDPNAQATVLKDAKADVVLGFRQTQQKIESESKLAEQQLEEQIKQRTAQIRSLLSDEKQRSQLDDQIKQLNAAISSGQLKDEQLQQAKRTLSELQTLRSNPSSIDQRAKEFRTLQLQNVQRRKRDLLDQAQTELSKQMLILDNSDNVLMLVTAQPEKEQKAGGFSPQAFSLQLKDGNYSAKTCNVQGECFPVEVKACPKR
ncbi:hypothetical protein NIES2104_37610 [Leptolyngbya sp. NIES-2104]|nr:hypothetical protein NIES2104_37610 [Leptolyngbya sp. NIES-2104]